MSDNPPDMTVQMDLEGTRTPTATAETLALLARLGTFAAEMLQQGLEVELSGTIDVVIRTRHAPSSGS